MANFNNSVAGTQAGLRRGVLLGLTMAEAMLLLIFCLLLYIGVKEKTTLNTEGFDQPTVIEEEDKIKGEKAVARLLEIDNDKTKIITIEEFDDLTDAAQKINEVVEGDAIMVPNLTENDAIVVPIEEFDDVTDAVQRINDIRDLAEGKVFVVPIEEFDDLTDVAQKIKDVTDGKSTIIDKKFIASTLEKLAKLEKENLSPKWPPIIYLPEAKDYRFDSGSSVLTQSFKDKLKTIIKDKIIETLNEYDANIIEIIGHTDEEPMGGMHDATNLDHYIFDYLHKRTAQSNNFLGRDGDVPSIENDGSLLANDNAGLGYARAVTVMKVLSEIPELKKYTILPYSAASLILPDDTLSEGASFTPNSERRRIEIRVRQKRDQSNW